jgi:adenylate cyclase
MKTQQTIPTQRLALVAESLGTGDLVRGGERKHVAVLFADLRGFTQYAEPLSPERIVSELNDYLDSVVPAIRAQGGVVDKYIGDAIMAVFGIPNPGPEDAARAVRAAAAMQVALQEHNRERERKGLPPLVQGIGLHCGDVIAGNIGTKERVQYTVIGDAVNVASRLESLSKKMDYSILLSKELFAEASLAGEAAELPAMVSVGSSPIRGRKNSVEVFAVRLEELED